MTEITSQRAEPSRLPASDSWLPYTLPIFVFLLMTNFESSFSSTTPDGQGAIPFPYAYGAKILVVGCLTVFSLVRFGLYREILPLPRGVNLLLAVGTGLAVLAFWVGLDGYYPDLPFLGARTAFDPHTLPPSQRVLFLSARMFGLVILVPIFEELFWRSFLMRCLIASDYQNVPVGKVTVFAALTSSALFAMAHPEWLPAFLTGVLWSWLLARTRSLGSCVISHVVANLALGIYVLTTQQWKYW